MSGKRSLFKVLVDPSAAVEKTLSALSGARWVGESRLDGGIAGCRLGEDFFARYCNPRFPRSVVDGYAVDYRDVLGASEESPVRLRVGGRIRVYESAEGFAVGGGVAVEVDTGSMLPVGANAVVPVEYTDERGGVVEVYRSVGFGDNVAWPCSDVGLGELIARRGERISHRLVGVFASQGAVAVRVIRPRVCVFSTGNELVEPGGEIRDPLIYDSNRFMLLSLLSEYCVDIVDHGLLRDDLGEIISALDSCEERGADVVLFSGGTSAGVEDNVYRAIREKGDLLVHGLKLKPGKPTAIGVTRRGVLVIGLPGNPNSAYNVFVNVVSRVFEAKGVGRRASSDTSGSMDAVLALPVKAVRGRVNYNPAILLRSAHGGVYVFPLSYESYMITRLALADALVPVPEDVHESIRSGERVRVVVLNPEWGEYRASVVGEELSTSALKGLPGDVKPVMYGSGFAVAGIETCSADIGVVGKSFPGLYSMSPACSYLEDYVKRKYLLLRSPRGSGGDSKRVAVYPASYSILYRIRSVLKGDPVYASSYRAALYMVEKGVVDYAVVPADIVGEKECCRVERELVEDYVVFYRDVLMEDIVSTIIESMEY